MVEADIRTRQVEERELIQFPCEYLIVARTWGLACTEQQPVVILWVHSNLIMCFAFILLRVMYFVQQQTPQVGRSRYLVDWWHNRRCSKLQFNDLSTIAIQLNRQARLDSPFSATLRAHHLLFSFEFDGYNAGILIKVSLCLSVSVCFTLEKSTNTNIFATGFANPISSTTFMFLIA